jgi:PAS domain S-box-containing protein
VRFLKQLPEQPSTMDEQSFKRLLRRTVAIPVALLALLAVLLTVEILSLTSALRWVDHAEEVIANSRQLMRYMTDMETGIRGYYLTGDRRFLDPFAGARPGVFQELDLLQRLTANEPEAQQRLSEVRQLDLRWMDYANHLLEQPTGRLSAQEYAAGKDLMDQIRTRQLALLHSEEGSRDAHFRRATTLNRVIIATAAVLSIVIAVLLFTLTRRELKQLSDIYEQHLRTEEEKSRQLADSRERFQITLNSLGDAVIATDANGRVRYINPVAQQLTGWADYLEARGRPLTEVACLIDERTREPLADPVELVRRAEGVVGMSNHIMLMNRLGGEYPIEMNAAPIMNRRHQLTGVVLVFRDVTQRRQTEQTLRASDRLGQAGRLAATIAHEIRNPLDTVSNLLFLLRQEPYATTDTKHYLELATDELARITQITGQLLTFHREAQSPLAVSLVKVIESVLTLYAPQISMQGITVIKRFETNRSVRGFPGELRQVFANLVANAVHSMPNGGRLLLHVFESSLPFDSERKGIRITVLDNGTGIPPGVRKNLFAPFYTTKGESGTGLGLWVTRGIIEKHEGTIHFVSTVRPGRCGTAFSVFLPFEQTLGKLDLPKPQPLASVAQ